MKQSAQPAPESQPETLKPLAPLPRFGCEELVDELGDIERVLAPHRTLIAREEALRKKIRDAHEDVDATREIRASGAKFYALLGPRGWASVINMKKLGRLIGAAKVLAFARCTLGDLEEHAPGQEDQVVTKAQTGPRSLKIFQLQTIRPVMQPPFETFKSPTCRGCYALGNACGKCEKCAWERARQEG